MKGFHKGRRVDCRTSGSA